MWRKPKTPNNFLKLKRCSLW